MGISGRIAKDLFVSVAAFQIERNNIAFPDTGHQYFYLPIGTQQSDPTRTSNVARVLNETSGTVANFRAAVSPLAPMARTSGPRNAQTTAANAAPIQTPWISAWPARLRARARSPCPRARATRAAAAMLMPMPTLMVKNRIAPA